MALPISASMVSALVARATTENAQGKYGAATSMLAFLTQQLTGQPDNLTTLESAVRGQAAAEADRLAGILNQRASDEPAFGAELHTRWTRMQAETTDRGGVSNTVVGDVSGPVVQARDVSGGISFNASPQATP